MLVCHGCCQGLQAAQASLRLPLSVSCSKPHPAPPAPPYTVANLDQASSLDLMAPVQKVLPNFGGVMLSLHGLIKLP